MSFSYYIYNNKSEPFVLTSDDIYDICSNLYLGNKDINYFLSFSSDTQTNLHYINYLHYDTIQNIAIGKDVTRINKYH